MTHYGNSTLVIGERIKQELKRQGKTSVWLAKQLGCHHLQGLCKVIHRHWNAFAYQ